MPWFPTCGGVDTSDANVTPEDVLEGKIVYSHNGPVVGTIPSLPEKTWIPGPEEQVIPGGHYIAGTQTIKGDPNLYPENIVKGKTIFGVEGTGIPVEFNDPTFIEKLCVSDFKGKVDFSKDSEYFYTYGTSIINKHNSTTGEVIWSQSISDDTKKIYSNLYITPDDLLIYYGSKNGYLNSIIADSGISHLSVKVLDTTKSVEYIKGIENYKGSTFSLLLFVPNTTVIGRVDFIDTSTNNIETITIPSSYSIDVDDKDIYYYCNSSSPRKICKICTDSADNYEIETGTINSYGIQPDGKYLYTVAKVDNTTDKLSQYNAETGALVRSVNVDVNTRDNCSLLITDSLSEYIYLQNTRTIYRYSTDLLLNYANNPFLFTDGTVSSAVDSASVDSNGEYVYVSYLSEDTSELYKYKQVFGSIYPLENPDPYINIDRIIKRKKDTYKTYETPVEIWDDEYDSEIDSISCTDDGHYVYICTQNNGFIKMNSVNKKIIWSYNDGMSGYVVVDHNDKYVYVATNSALTKLDASNGNVVISLSDYARSRTAAYSIQNMTITDDNEYLVYINNNSSSASSSKIVKFKTSDMSVKWEKTPHTNYINQLDLVSKTGDIYFNKSSQIPIETDYILPFTGGVNNVVYFNSKYLLLPNKTFITNSETNTTEFTYYLGDTLNIAYMEKHTISTDGMNTNFSDYTITKIVASSYVCIIYVKGIDNASLTESETSLNKYYYTYDGVNWSEGSFGLYCPTSNIINCSNTFIYSASDKSTYNKLFSSYDGINWTENTNYTDTYTNGTVWGLGYVNSRYLLVSNILQYSTDFKTFSTATIASLPSETAVGENFANKYGEIHCVYIYSRYYLACADGIYYSSDLNTWTKCTFTYPTSADFPSELSYPLLMTNYSNYIYIIESASGNTAEISNYVRSIYITSTSQTSFNVTNIKAAPLLSETSSTSTLFVTGGCVSDNAIAGLYYSTDGKTWTQSNLTTGLFSDVCNFDIWVAGSSDDGLYYSIDGKTWTQSNITTGHFSAVYNTTGIWIAGSSIFDSKGLYYSTNGKTWFQSNITSGGFYTINYANDIYLACGEGLYYSTDGKTWEKTTVSGGYLTSGGFRNAYYADAMWVVCSNDDYCSYYSKDGKAWAQCEPAVEEDVFCNIVYYSNKSIWVAGSEQSNGLQYSTNGMSWTQSNISTGIIRTVCYGNNIVIAGGYNTGIYYSTDGKTWTQSNTTTGSFNLLYYYEDIYIAVSGNNKGLYYSTDGKTWTQSNITSGSFMTSIGESYHPVTTNNNNNYIYCNSRLASFPAVTADDTHSNTKYSIGSLENSKIQQLTYQDTRTTNTTYYGLSTFNNSTAILLGQFEGANQITDNYAYSTDSGATWTGAHMPKKGEWIHVGKLMSKYIAVCNSSNNLAIYESSDGKSWSQGSITNSNGNALANNMISINNDENDVKIKVITSPLISSFAIIVYTTIGINVEGYYVSSSLSTGSAFKVQNFSSNMTSTPLCAINDTSQKCMFLGWSNNGKFMYSDDMLLSLMNGDYYTEVTSSESISNWDMYSEITGVKLSDTQYLVSMQPTSSSSLVKVGLLDTSANTLTFRASTWYNGRFVAPANGKLYALNTYSVNGNSGGGKFTSITNYDTTNTVKDDVLPSDLSSSISKNDKTYTTLCSSGTNLITVINGEPYAYYTKNPLVISGGDDRYIRAIDFLTGNTIWSFSLSYAANGIYVSDDKKFVYATVNGNSSSANLYKYNINATNLSSMKYSTNSYSSAIFGNGDKIFTVKSSNGGILAAYDPEYLTNDYSLTGANDTSTGQEYGRCLTYDSAGDYIYAGTYMNTGKGHLHKYKLKEIEYEKIARVYKTTTTGEDTEGKVWTQSNINSGDFYTVYYGNSIWVAGSISGKGLYYSTNGKVWTQSNITSGDFRSVYNANGIWVAASDSDNGLYYSTDGKVWTQSNINSGYFYTVYYDNSIWVACSGKGIFYSTDGKSWTQSNINSGDFYTVYNANGIWIAGGIDTGLYYSTNGKVWTQSNITSGDFRSVYNANGIWVAGSDSDNGLYYSTDGKVWTQSNIDNGSFNTVYYANDIWVAGSSVNKGLYYSTDGKSWTQSNITSGDFRSVYNANGIIIAGSYSSNGIFYSTDGKSWIQSNINSGDFYTVYNANGIWVAGSIDTGLYYSE